MGRVRRLGTVGLGLQIDIPSSGFIHRDAACAASAPSLVLTFMTFPCFHLISERTPDVALQETEARSGSASVLSVSGLQ